MNNFVFHNQCKIFFGKDTLANVIPEIEKFGKNLLMVADDNIKKLPVYLDAQKLLLENGFTLNYIDGVHSNPRLDKIYEGIAFCKQNQVDFILAIGGGSVIDTAKTIAFGSRTDRDVWDYFKTEQTPDRLPITDAIPLGVISTMAASGSEMNATAVVTNAETKEKLYVFRRDPILPRFSVMDPQYTYTIPPKYTAYGAFDIFCHLFEQDCTPTENVQLQSRFCEAVMKTVFESALIVKEDPCNYAARANLMWSACVTLMGITDPGMVADSTGHAIEHEISAWFDIAHGAGLSILFPNWMEYAARRKPERFSNFAVNVWNVDPRGKTAEEVAMEGIRLVREFVKQIGAPSTFREVGIENTHFDEIAQAAVRFGNLGSYCIIDQQDVRNILEMSY